MPEPIDLYFDFASPYGFIAAMEIDALAAAGGRAVRWHPFLLGAVYKKVGQSPLENGGI
jgi:2-hydroxychromene-2-carboxylate isomerase